MLGSNVEQMVREIVLGKIIANEMFTAHDVTRAVRAETGRNVDVPHHDVKLIVHEMFETGKFNPDYRRHEADFPGVSPRPWIYHNAIDDYKTYKRPADKDTVPAKPGLSISVGTLPPGSDLCHVDARETLLIPNRHIKSLNLDFGNKAYVYGDVLANCLFLTGSPPPTGDFGEYLVDKAKNVRITQGCLSRLGCGGTKYLVRLEDGLVKITRQG